MKKLLKRLTVMVLTGIIVCTSTGALASKRFDPNNFSSDTNIEDSFTHKPTLFVKSFPEGRQISITTSMLYASNFPNASVRVYRAVNNGEWQERTQESPRLVIPQIHYGKYHGYKDKRVKNGNIYRYKVARIYNGKEVQISDPAVVAYLDKIDRNKIVITNTNDDTTMKISWERNSKADGYQIMYSTVKYHGWDKKVRKLRSVKGGNTTTLTLKNRTPGKQYKVLICPYKVYKGKKYYGRWCDSVKRYPGRGW